MRLGLDSPLRHITRSGTQYVPHHTPRPLSSLSIVFPRARAQIKGIMAYRYTGAVSATHLKAGQRFAVDEAEWLYGQSVRRRAFSGGRRTHPSQWNEIGAEDGAHVQCPVVSCARRIPAEWRYLPDGTNRAHCRPGSIVHGQVEGRNRAAHGRVYDKHEEYRVDTQGPWDACNRPWREMNGQDEDVAEQC